MKKDTKTAAPTKGDAMAVTTKNQALAVPDYLKGHGALGLEQVGREDVIYPRLAIAQSGSPAYKKASPQRIDGLEEGEFYNTLTREIYGTKVELVPILFFKTFIKFRDMEEGGGILGMKDSAEGIPPTELEFGADGEKPVWTEFRNFLSWIPDRKELVVVSMKSTSTKAAKEWNSFMRHSGLPAFASSYVITSIAESKNNFDYFKHAVQLPGKHVTKELFAILKEQYENLSGTNVKFDTADLADETAEKEF